MRHLFFRTLRHPLERMTSLRVRREWAARLYGTAMRVDAPGARILPTVPVGSRAGGDLEQLGERQQLMMANTPPALGPMWLVSSTEAGR